jgi:hypothetical protein
MLIPGMRRTSRERRAAHIEPGRRRGAALRRAADRMMLPRQCLGDSPVSSDLNDLEYALQAYFDGLYEGDTTKLAGVVHDVAHLFSVTDGRLGDMSREQWFDLVRSRNSAQSQDLKRHDWVVQIDRSGPTTAFAKVQCQIPPRYFTDYLTFVKLADGWRIVSKTFHTETH